ncbi:MAG TPA: PhoH family protein [Candidatus Eremiobacteraceae bacterium]|nr:PhoH family protein [Candidatus Eremiobacteraceae bacterium]
MTQTRVSIADLDDRIRLFGEFDGVLHAVERATNAAIHVEGDELVIAGARDATDKASSILRRLIDAADAGEFLTADDVTTMSTNDAQTPDDPRDKDGERSRFISTGSVLATTRRGRAVRPRTNGQRAFVDAVTSHTLTFAVGPAGTGKTFLAVIMALAALRAGEVQRIVLSRPAVEAGENLGFLPGDFQAKVDPYLRPLFDALGEIMEPNAIERAVERGQIEVAPLAYMRGRTLADAFVVLDEAQNASRDQMKMFLTRIGANSRMVVCGDVTQIDLVRRNDSGLVHAAKLFLDVKDIAIVELTEADVVRHPLIRAIIAAYSLADR